MGFAPLDYTDCSQKKCVCSPTVDPLRTAFDCDNPCVAGEVFSNSCCICHSPCPTGQSYFCRYSSGFPPGCYDNDFDFTADPFFSF